MLDVKRYNEIKAMTDEQRIRLAESLDMSSWADSHKVSIVSLMARENELKNPERARRLREALNIR